MISIITAYDQNRLIGNDSSLPWHIPADLKYFKQLTEGRIVVMGRKTFESLGKPLPNRINIVLTNNKESFYSRGCLVFDSLYALLNFIDIFSDEEVFIIGGSSIYSQFLPYVNRLYVTKIEHEFEGNTYFPDFNEDDWKMISSTKGIKDENNPYDYYFNIYERKL
jgi:dihydrofolate reductase